MGLKRRGHKLMVWTVYDKIVVCMYNTVVWLNLGSVVGEGLWDRVKRGVLGRGDWLINDAG